MWTWSRRHHEGSSDNRYQTISRAWRYAWLELQAAAHALQPLLKLRKALKTISVWIQRSIWGNSLKLLKFRVKQLAEPLKEIFDCLPPLQNSEQLSVWQMKAMRLERCRRLKRRFAALVDLVLWRECSMTKMFIVEGARNRQNDCLVFDVSWRSSG